MREPLEMYQNHATYVAKSKSKTLPLRPKSFFHLFFFQNLEALGVRIPRKGPCSKQGFVVGELFEEKISTYAVYSDSGLCNRFAEDASTEYCARCNATVAYV